MDNNEPQVSAEELAAEQSQVQLPKEEDVRAEIITELGLDPEADKEKIEKAVKREMNQRTMTSKAIKAKILHRDTAAELRKKLPPEQKVEEKELKKDDSLTTDDIYALMEEKVPKEDVPKVKEAAKLLGTDIAGALKNDIVRATLKKAAEHRASQAAANIGPGRPGAKTPTEAEILAEAAKGNIPKPGSPEAETLFWARRGGKRK